MGAIRYWARAVPPSFRIVFVGVLLGSASIARADEWPIRFGGMLGIAAGDNGSVGYGEVRLEARADYRLLPFFGLRGGLALGVGGGESAPRGSGAFRGLPSAGGVLCYDFGRLTPELYGYVGAGLGNLNGVRAGALAGLQIRGEPGQPGSFFVTGGGEWDTALDLFLWMGGIGAYF
jgi:hypothetical protein